MKTLQRILMFYFLSAICILQAQENERKGWDGAVKGGPTINVSYESTMPNSATKDAYITNSSGIRGDVFVPFLLFRKGWDGTVKGGNFGFNIGGTYNFGGNGEPSAALPPAYIIGGQISSSVAYKGIDPRNPGFRIGGGPQVNFNFGERFIFSPMVLAEYFSMTQNELSAIQTSEINGKPKEYTLWTLPETKTTGLAITPKVRLQYLFTKNLVIFADGGYIFGPKINTQISSLVPLGNPNQGGQYEQQQLDLGTQVNGDIKTTSYNAFVANVGLSYVFGGNNGSGENPTPAKVNINKSRSNIKQQVSTGNNNDDEEENDENGKDIFSVTHLKKESSGKQNCLRILSPSNGSNQKIGEPVRILLNSESIAKTGNVDIKIYKISDDKDYFNKKENRAELFDTENLMILSTRFADQNKKTDFKPISVVGKQSGAVIESSIEKGKLTEGAYKLLVVGNCGVTTSNFMVSSSALTTVSLTTNCKEKFGDYSYTFIVKNTGTNPINITSIPSFTSSTGVITSFTSTPALPFILGPGATQNFTGSFSYSGVYTGDVYASVSGHQVGNVNLTSQDTEMGELKSCICDFCNRSADYDSDQTPNATYTATSNSLSIHQNWWDMNPATSAMIVAAKAEIISFSREVSEECMKCDKDSSKWGNFISGTSGTANGSFGNATGTVAGNTHHTLYFANPNKFSFDLNISLPPISTLSCCCEKIRIKIRYTYTYRDQNGLCRMCSEVFEYRYQKGKCPIIHNPDLPSSVSSLIKNTKIKN